MAVLWVAPFILLFAIRKLREQFWGYCKNNIKLTNKVAVVTGANSGIGYEVAKELARREALVILACRSLKSANEAIRTIKKQIKNSQLVAMELDLESLQSIKEFSLNLKKMFPKVHLLINNAGVAYPKNKLLLTKNDIEMHYGVNHVGHHYLTILLLDVLKQAAPSRVVVVSSSLHEKGEIDFNLLGSNKPGTKLYANSKLANVYFSRELAKRTKGTGISVYALCPGWVYTSLFRHSFKWYHYILISPIAFFFMRTPKQGAQTVIYCATEPTLINQSGVLYRDCQPYKSKIKFNDEIGAKLWIETENLIQNKI